MRIKLNKISNECTENPLLLKAPNNNIIINDK